MLNQILISYIRENKTKYPGFLENCQKLAYQWDESMNVAEFTDEAMTKIKAHYPVGRKQVYTKKQDKKTSGKPRSTPRPRPAKDTWNQTVEEIRSSGNETWINLLDAKLELFGRLTPCQAKARKKKLAEDWEAFCKNCGGLR